MIPYKVKFIFDEKGNDAIHFESNGKPFKGEVYTIQHEDGKLLEVRITEVTKIVIRNKSSRAIIEYACKTESHTETSKVIGFGKRS